MVTPTRYRSRATHRQVNPKGMEMRQLILNEIKVIGDEMERAEADGNSRLSVLQGWDEALNWMLEKLDEGVQSNVH